MLKVAIFTEGQSELIFIRELLKKHIFEYQELSIKCFRLNSKDLEVVPYDWSVPEPSYYFQIVNVGNDNKVVSYIRETFPNLLANGFELIIGLRDVYSAEYERLSTGSVDNGLIQLLIEKQIQTLNSITEYSIQIKLFFAIMEFEAWLLSMPNLYMKIDPVLTTDFIQENLDFNLQDVIPQNEFYHPANKIDEIFRLIDRRYKKSGNEIEGIVASISNDDIDDALTEGKCPSFKAFFDEIVKLL